MRGTSNGSLYLQQVLRIKKKKILIIICITFEAICTSLEYLFAWPRVTLAADIVLEKYVQLQKLNELSFKIKRNGQETIGSLFPILKQMYSYDDVNFIYLLLNIFKGKIHFCFYHQSWKCLSRGSCITGDSKHPSRVTG